MTLKKKIISSWIVATFVLTSLLTGSALYILFQTHRADIYAHLSTLARDKAEDLSLMVKTYEDVLKNITYAEEFSGYLKYYRDEALLAHFNRYKNIFPVLSFINEDGHEELKMINGSEADTLKDYSREPFFKKLKPDRVFIMPAGFSEELHEMVIRMFLLKRHYFGNRFMGILMAELPVKKIITPTIRPIKLSNAYIVITDERGHVIFRKKNVLKRPFENIELGGLSPNVKRIKLNGKDILVCAQKIEDVGFYVLSVLPYSAFIREPKRLIYLSSMLTLVFLLFFLLVVLRASERITSPLVRLVEATERIAQGRFNEHIELKVPASEEIGQLVSSFNRMVDELDRTVISKDYVEGIIESMTDALIITDEEGIILHINREAQRLTGYQRDELLSRSIDNLFKEKPPGEEFFYNVSNERITAEETLVTKHMREVPVFVGVSSLGDEEMLFMIKDISPLKEYERKLEEKNRQLKEKNKELQEFAYIASHDLREPLRKINFFGERLIKRYSGELSEKAKDYLERMIRASRRMDALITGLLEYSRVETRAGAFEEVDLNRIVEVVKEDLYMVIREKDARIIHDNLPVLEADPLQMRQLFQNLISNSIKFSRDGVPPEVSISAVVDEKNNRVVISVIDNGIGFEPEYSDKIFGMFQRLHGRSEFEGTGIGLAICKRIVERHGGSIKASSRVGEGSVFDIKLPLKHQEEE